MLTPDETAAVLLSLKVAFWSVMISLPLGYAAAWMLARWHFPGKILVDAFIHLPLVLPPVVIGFMLLATFGLNGAVGGWLYDWFGITFAFRWTGAALASAIMGFPLMVRAIRLSLTNIDPRLEIAARTLGASPLRAFFTITLPLTLPGIIAGATLAFARSLGEFGATITFVSNIPGETQTLPLAIYNLTQMPGSDAAAWKLSLVAVLLSVLALALSEWLVTRSNTASASSRSRA